MGLMAFSSLAGAQQPMPQTTKESIAGTPAVKTEVFKGTVIEVDGNHLAVRMSTGDVRTFNVPESRRFIVDGKELTVGQLKTGTKLTATVITTTTPVSDRTTTIGTGKVWWVSGNTVILTLPNNENRMYKVNENYRFTVGGEKAAVHDLKKGMMISAQKIVEEPRTEIASNTEVIGEAPPPPKPVVAATPAPEPVRARPAAAPTPKPEQVADRAAEAPPVETLPAELPKSGSEVPLIGLLGLLLVGGSTLLRALRRP